MDYTVIYEETPTGFSAYLPDLPGCIAAGTTRAEVERLIQSAVRMHLEAMRSAGEPLPHAQRPRRHGKRRAAGQVT